MVELTQLPPDKVSHDKEHNFPPDKVSHDKERYCNGRVNTTSPQIKFLMTKKGIAMVELTQRPPDKVSHDKERYCDGRANTTSPR